MFVLAIDQGTTNTKALVFDAKGQIHGSASIPCTPSFPQPGWAEVSAADIWATTQAVIKQATQQAGVEIAAIGISNQRETLVVWDSVTGEPVCPAPLWQCRRTADTCAKLVEAGFEHEVTALTGLGINPLFPASKLTWLLKNRPEVADLQTQGRLRAGTVDAWLLWKLTNGTSFATDHSNASRTLLFDTEKLEWSPRLGEIFHVPLLCLPTPMASDSRFGTTLGQAGDLPDGIPIHAIMGDSHAALFGHGIRLPGSVKATIGTGSSLMAPTAKRVFSNHGLSSTIAWTQGDTTTYALEGNITVSAQAAAFTAELLGVDSVADLSDLAQSVPDSDGVHFIPALAGLGAPHWNDQARGMFSGLSLGTTRSHMARAAFEAIAQQIADVFEALREDTDGALTSLHADGGGSSNPWLMQLMADLLGVRIERRSVAEIGALGVAAMAFEALGQEFSLMMGNSERFEPNLSEQARRKKRAAWNDALKQAMHQA